MGKKENKQDKEKTLTFDKGTFLKPDNVSFIRHEPITGLDRIPDQFEGLIPSNFVVAGSTDQESPSQFMVNYSKGQSDTYMHLTWMKPKQVQEELWQFKGHGFERTEFVSKSGKIYEFTVQFWQEIHAAKNPDKTFSSADFVLLNKPLPVIKNNNVTYLAVNGKRKQVIDYNYDISTGECKIKYKKFRK
jgi:hypothetical protein